MCMCMYISVLCGKCELTTNQFALSAALGQESELGGCPVEMRGTLALYTQILGCGWEITFSSSC